MYPSIRIPWSAAPSSCETLYRSSGLIRTKGTIFILPPSLQILREAFSTPPRPQSRMSAGAVALCKHFERGGASSEHGLPHPFWPLPVGSNENKTSLAAGALENVLEDAKWRNVMLLHEGVAVYEIRNSLGYGMRWTLELRADETACQGEMTGTPENHDREWIVFRTTFRGFLEPIEGLNKELLVLETQKF